MLLYSDDICVCADCRMLWLQFSADGTGAKAASGSSSGQQLVTPLSAGTRDEWHKVGVIWIAKSDRPPALCGDDVDFKKYISTITYGRYQPPCADTVNQTLYRLEKDGTKTEIQSLDVYMNFGQDPNYILRKLEPSVVLDIWGEGGKSILGLMVYYIDADFKMQEKLLKAVPFSDVNHNAEEIEKALKKALANWGVGVYDENFKCPRTGLVELRDTVGDFVHGCTSDEASNMVKALWDIEGGPCRCHKIQNSLKFAMKGDKIQAVEKKCRGIVAHFRRSDKVSCVLL